MQARDALYDRLREETDLTANLIQEAIRRAVHAVDSGVDRWKNGKRTNKPEFPSWSMVYDERSATFNRNKISLSMVNGRIECDFELPADGPTPYEEHVLSDDYEFRTSTLQYDQATTEFSFHVKTRKAETDGEAVEIEGSDDTGNQTALGIDLGVNSLAVASTGTFWSGDEYDYGYRSSRSAEQSCNSVGRKLHVVCTTPTAPCAFAIIPSSTVCSLVGLVCVSYTDIYFVFQSYCGIRRY